MAKKVKPYIYLVGIEVSDSKKIKIQEVKLISNKITEDRFFFDAPKERQVFIEYEYSVSIKALDNSFLCCGRYNQISGKGSGLRFHLLCREKDLKLAHDILNKALIEKFTEISEVFYEWREKLNKYFEDQ